MIWIKIVSYEYVNKFYNWINYFICSSIVMTHYLVFIYYTILNWRKSFPTEVKLRNSKYLKLVDIFSWQFFKRDKKIHLTLIFVIYISVFILPIQTVFILSLNIKLIAFSISNILYFVIGSLQIGTIGTVQRCTKCIYMWFVTSQRH